MKMNANRKAAKQKRHLAASSAKPFNSFLFAFSFFLFSISNVAESASLECSAADFPAVDGVAWDPVEDERLTGYRVYINGSATAEIAPDATTADVSTINVIEGSNAVYLTAFGADPEIESDPSNTIEVVCRESNIPSPTIRLTADATPQSVTAGKEVLAVWDNPTTVYRDLVQSTEFLARVDADLSAESSGILFEAGGDSIGSVLYAHNGTLYLQCGTGNEFGHSDSRGEAAWQIAKSNPQVEAHCTTTGATLYVDGKSVASDEFSAPSIGGADGGGIAGRGAVHPTTRSAGSGAASPYSDAIRSVTFYRP